MSNFRDSILVLSQRTQPNHIDFQTTLEMITTLAFRFAKATPSHWFPNNNENDHNIGFHIYENNPITFLYFIQLFAIHPISFHT